MEKLKTKNRNETPGAEAETGGFIMNSGGTTFLVGLHFSETSKDTMADKIKKLVKKDAESGYF